MTMEVPFKTFIPSQRSTGDKSLPRDFFFQPQHGEVTFHLPLHRYLAAFISLVRLQRFLVFAAAFFS